MNVLPLNEHEPWATLLTLATSFIGAGAGSLLAIAFSRRSAINQTLGAEYARRRIEAIERIYALLQKLAACIDLAMGIPDSTEHGERKGALGVKLARELDQADLYLSRRIVKLLRVYESWATEADPHYPPDAPEHSNLFLLKDLLGEAMMGAHTPSYSWIYRAWERGREYVKRSFRRRRSFKGVPPK